MTTYDNIAEADRIYAEALTRAALSGRYYRRPELLR
jgi:hypothetical protein